MISQRAIDLIVSCEVSSKGYYEKNYRHPEWPGGASGVTIAIGYDLGYATLNKERADWAPHCAEPMLKVMDRCLGVHGDPARSLLPSVRPSIDISWDAAMAVFLERDVPEWTARVVAAIPKAAGLPPDCLGVLVSLAYNRGASFNNSGDRYREMRQIKAHIVSGNLPAVAADLREMKRLWPDMKGLRDRRDAEAKLWEQGLTAPAPKADKPVANDNPPPVLPPKPAGKAETGVATGAGAAAGTATQSIPADHIWAWWEIALAAGGVIAVVAIAWLVVRHLRDTTQVARAKDHPDVPAQA